MEMSVKLYDSAKCEREGIASRKRALLWSILKWLKLATEPRDTLIGMYHSNCALCNRYSGGIARGCRGRCPLSKADYHCSEADMPWDRVNSAYCALGCNVGPLVTTMRFRAYRKAARAMLKALLDVYNDLYPNDRVHVDLKARKIRSV